MKLKTPSTAQIVQVHSCVSEKSSKVSGDKARGFWVELDQFGENEEGHKESSGKESSVPAE